MRNHCGCSLWRMCWVGLADWPICGEHVMQLRPAAPRRGLIPPSPCVCLLLVPRHAPSLAPSGPDGANCYSARGLQTWSIFQLQLDFTSPSLPSLIIFHQHHHHGIASASFDLLDDYRLAIRIAESCLCSQPGYLFVLRSHSSFRPDHTTYHAFTSVLAQTAAVCLQHSPNSPCRPAYHAC